jgi:hypothetical protein
VTETTPNATIRRAAEALDLAAAGAKCSAAGRWYVHPKDGGYPQRVLDNAVFIAETLEEPTGPVRLAPFIASMDPRVAFGVARLLLAVADADLSAAHAAAVDLAVDYLNEKRECARCGMRVGVEADGALGEHGTMAAMCPGEDAR